ncbi:MAG: hypothetical protein IT365_16555 [Candidatus Hydrogenedentes bacterium]|nr:hypothetical protein [Candidatus Hydrogenedentota bacterium]
MFSGDDMREIFRNTQIVKKPTHGIISGYHELPYVCLGTRLGLESGTMRVRGKVQVSPRFVIRPSHCEPSYGEIFGEENVDEALTGRMFGFLGFRGRPVECTSEHLEVRHLEATLDRVLSETLDDLERFEDITTGVIVTPNSRYYPISIERFIASILDDEFAL